MDKALTITVDAQGNVIVARPLSDEATSDIFVAKLDREGRLLWQRCLANAPATVAASSLPPPAFDFASAETRDSVEPYLLSDVEELHARLADKRGRWRNLALSAGAAVLVASAMVAAAAAADARSPGAAMSPAWIERRVVHADGLRGELGWSALEETADPFAPGAAEAQAAPAAQVQAAPEPASEARKAEALRNETLALLSAGLPHEALPLAHAFVQAAPADAMAYLCLGAALQEMGLAKEAREAYSACVDNAKRGNVSECWALGGVATPKAR
jgi:hypothetical protein